MTGAEHRTHESISQAAERTGINAQTFRRRIAYGQLPAYRSGRLIRVEPADVDALLVRIPTATVASVQLRVESPP